MSKDFDYKALVGPLTDLKSLLRDAAAGLPVSRKSLRSASIAVLNALPVEADCRDFCLWNLFDKADKTAKAIKAACEPPDLPPDEKAIWDDDGVIWPDQPSDGRPITLDWHIRAIERARDECWVRTDEGKESAKIAVLASDLLEEKLKALPDDIGYAEMKAACEKAEPEAFKEACQQLGSQRADSETSATFHVPPETPNTPNTPNTPQLFPGGVPKNIDVEALVVLLDAEKAKPESERRDRSVIAREFTGETKGADKQAESLLAQIRRLRRKRKVNL